MQRVYTQRDGEGTEGKGKGNGGRERGGVILVRNANISEELRLREVMLQL